MSEPWRPPTPGIELVPHYDDLQERDAESFAGKRVFIVGKRNSAFEIADALLPWACQLILGSPHHVRPSIVDRACRRRRGRATSRCSRTTASAAAASSSTARSSASSAPADGWRGARGGDDGAGLDGLRRRRGDRDDRLRDAARRPARARREDVLQGPAADADAVLGELDGAGDLLRGRVDAGTGRPAQVRLPEPAPPRSAAFATTRASRRSRSAAGSGIQPERPRSRRTRSSPTCSSRRRTRGRSGVSRPTWRGVLSFDAREGIRDEGILPVTPFVDSAGPPAARSSSRPTRRTTSSSASTCGATGGSPSTRCRPAFLHDFRTPEHRAELESLLDGLVRERAA